jgi:hypothetical protein
MKISVTKIGCVGLIVCFALGLSSCVAPSIAPSPASDANSTKTIHEDLQAIYSSMSHDGGKLYTLDPNKSSVRIFAFRSGSAAKLGHNHVLSAPKFLGYFYLPPSGTSAARFDLEFRLDQLELDNPAYRASSGEAFARVIAQEAIATTRDHMLGESGFQADQFPLVRIHSLSISGESPKFAAKVQVEIHGKNREIWIPLNVDGLPDSLAVTGSFVLRQTDFGIAPYSALGGILAVQDEVVVEFQLHGN